MANSTDGIGFPKLASVQPFATPISTVGTWDLLVDANYLKNGIHYNTTSAINDEAEWNIVLGAGTWTFEILSATTTDRAIYTLEIDGASVGTIDHYTAGTVYNTLKSITGIVVQEGGKKSVKLVAASKNGASSGYRITHQGFYFRRTA